MNIADFYADNEARRESEELVYGEAWTDDDDRTATYKASLVVDTGEFYLVREPQPGGILAKYLDQLHLDEPDLAELTVEVLATLDRSDLDARLQGWQEEVESENSLRWLRSRLAAS